MLRDERGRVFGATMTSASGEILANGDVDGRAGVRELTITFAVDVGERWSVRGCDCRACMDGEPANDGFGSALT